MDGYFSKGGRLSGHLGRRLVVMILLANTVLSIFASGVQLYASYKQGRAGVWAMVQVIENNFRQGFEEALWKYDLPLVDALLEGIIHSENVTHVLLEADNGARWEVGTPDGSGEQASGEIVFEHTNAEGQKSALGRMYIGLSMKAVNQRLWSQFLTLLLTNLTKTLCATAIILLLFDRMVTRHLEKIAKHVSQRSWLERRQMLSLDRRANAPADDLDHIVTAINTAMQKGRDDFGVLEREVQRRRVVETLLRQRSQALLDINEEQAQFTYAISHDMKSPTNTIHMLLTELSHTENANLSRDGETILQDAQDTVLRMSTLIEDVLNYARTIGEGMEMGPVNLADLLKEILQDLKGDIAASGGEVEVGELPKLKGNSTQLRMLFQNLLSNGLKFSKEGVAPRVTVTEVLTTKENFARIRVSDNGIGIPLQHQDKVFALFQRLHTHSQYPGSGLGLTVCKRVVANHGGEIFLASSLGDGCAIDIELPRV